MLKILKVRLPAVQAELDVAHDNAVFSRLDVWVRPPPEVLVDAQRACADAAPKPQETTAFTSIPAPLVSHRQEASSRSSPQRLL